MMTRTLLSTTRPLMVLPLVLVVAWAAAPAASGAGKPPVADLPKPIAIFTVGQNTVDGVADARTQYARYREQAVVVTNSKLVVMIGQGRNKSRWSDRSGQDLVCRTSADSGKTWSGARLVATHGLKSICPSAAVYDRNTGRIHVLYNLFMWDYTNVPKGIRGELGDLNCRQFTVTSDDDGKHGKHGDATHVSTAGGRHKGEGVGTWVAPAIG